MAISISLTVLPNNESDALKAVEALTRAGIGLAFDGINTTLSMTQYDIEED